MTERDGSSRPGGASVSKDRGRKDRGPNRPEARGGSVETPSTPGRKAMSPQEETATEPVTEVVSRPSGVLEGAVRPAVLFDDEETEQSAIDISLEDLEGPSSDDMIAERVDHVVEIEDMEDLDALEERDDFVEVGASDRPASPEESLESRDLPASRESLESAIADADVVEVSEFARDPASGLLPLAALSRATHDLIDEGREKQDRVQTESASREALAERELPRLQADLDKAARSEDTAAVVGILEEIVAAHEVLGQHDRAFFSAVRLARTDPRPKRLEMVIDLGRRVKDYPVLIDTVESVSERLGLEAEVDLGLRLVEVEHRDLCDPDAALARLDRLAHRFPDRRLFQRRLEILETEGRPRQLAEVLLRHSETLSDPAVASSLVRRAAAILEHHLEDRARAADVLLEYMARRDQGDPDIERDCVRLLEATGRHRDLARFLEDRLPRVEGEDRSALRLRISRLYGERLDDPASAERILRDGLRERPNDAELLDALERHFEAEGRFDAMLDVLVLHLESSGDGATRRDLRLRAANVAEERLGRVDLASDLVTNALRESPTDAVLLDEALCIRRRLGDSEGVLDVLALRLEQVEDDVTKARLLLEVARVLSVSRRDHDAAALRLREAIRLCPSDPEILATLARVESERGDPVAAVSALRQLVRVVDRADRDRRAYLHVQIGDLLLSPLGEVAAALAEYRTALDLDPTNVSAMTPLFARAEQEGDFVVAMDLGTRLAELSASSTERAALFERAGHIARERLGDELRAIDLFLRAVEADKEQHSARAALGELLMARRDYARAIPHLYGAAIGLSDPERVAGLFSSAGAAAEELGKDGAAIDAYLEAIARAPRMLEPLRRLSQLLERGEDAELLFDVSTNLALHHEAALDQAERARVYFRMALAKRRLGDSEASARLARSALEIDEASEDALDLLAECLREIGEPFEAAEALRRLALARANSPARRTALLRASELYAEHGDLARSAAVLSEVQTTHPWDTDVARRLARTRVQLGDIVSATEVLASAAEHAREASAATRADLLVEAGELMLGLGRDRAWAKRLFYEAMTRCPGHPAALSALEIMLEFDGELASLAALKESAADTYAARPPEVQGALNRPREESEGSTFGGLPGVERARSLLLEAIRLHRYRLGTLDEAARLARRLVVLSRNVDDLEVLASILDEMISASPSGAGSSSTSGVGGTTADLLTEAIDAAAELVEVRPAKIDGIRRLMRLRTLAGQLAEARMLAELLAAAGEAEPIPSDPSHVSHAVHASDASHASHASHAVQPSGETRLEVTGVRPAKPTSPSAVPADPREAGLASLFEGLGYSPLRAFEDLILGLRPKKKDLVGPAGLGIHVARPLEHASLLLGLEVPPVFVHGEPGTQVVAPTFAFGQPSFLVHLTAAQATPADVLRLHFGRALSLLRPRALALCILPLEVLRDGLVGLSRIEDPARLYADPKLARKRGRALERFLPAERKAEILQAVNEWLLRPDRSTLADERSYVLRTAERAGLSANGSLTSTIACLTAASRERVDREWFVPLLRFAATRTLAGLVGRLEFSAVVPQEAVGSQETSLPPT